MDSMRVNCEGYAAWAAANEDEATKMMDALKI